MIKKITPFQTYIVRHPVLRAGKPENSCAFKGDTLQTTLHFGYFIEEKIVGVISVFKNSSTFPLENQYQIRGMAVLEPWQSKGIGQQLICFVEQFLEQHFSKPYIIWCNAREKAVGFYNKMQYRVLGPEFIIENIGIHYIMYKQIN